MQAACYEYFENKNECQLLLCRSDKETKELSDAATLAGKKTFVLPDFRAKFGEDLRSYSEELFEILSVLNAYHKEQSPKKLLISPLRTILNPLPSQKHLETKTIEFGDSLDIKEFKDELLRWGYTFVDVVETKGEVSFRGDIIDIFSIDFENPIRISLFDDTVESIRVFECETQKSQKEEIEKITIIPTLFSLDEGGLSKVEESIEDMQSDAFVKDLLSLGFWGLGDEAISYIDELDTKFAFSCASEIHEIALFDERVDESKLKSIPVIPEASIYQDVEAPSLNNFLQFHQDKKVTLLARNEALIKQAGIELNQNVKFKESDLRVNIMSSDKLILSLNREVAKKRRKQASIVLDELKIGDYVVHENYGIGIFKGLTNTTVLGATKDFVTIEYQGDDKLLLPVENLDVIDRYVSEGGGLAVVDKLGKGSFQKLKEKTRIKLFEIAKEIIGIAAKRELTQGHKVRCDHSDIALFQRDAGFVYTNDQEKSVNEIFEDLKSGKVMDRLLSGDVGFGKTEVAMNAIFATIKSGYQAAFIAPTTLLSSQHFKSLRDRFKEYDINVVKLDRFTTTKEKNAILKGLKDGSVDVCVGTHSLLGLEIKNLALLVIDEEHKFGVKQKEKLKNMRENIHILSMSATPIPRSLNMALSSIKQYSQLLSAPSDREDVRTFVKEFDEKLVKEILMREIRRQGQIFYVHNRIASIETKAMELKKILPELRILVLHSKITASVTEKEMQRFENKEYDLLLSTSIIESGIHLPNVNTIVIEAADRFGMADLHQLRGRVGRGNRQGYCYYVVEHKESLTDQAKKRLVALESNSFLGSGSVLAYHDLEIRGGGNLIGEAQSGHIKNIGYTLYLKMLEDAINTLMNEKPVKKREVDIKLTVSAYLSDTYVGEDRVRLELYRRLSRCESVNDVYEIEEELNDRFGKIDTSTKQFLEIIIIKILAAQASIRSVANYNQNITLTDENEKKTLVKARSKDDDDIIAATLEYLRSQIKK